MNPDEAKKLSVTFTDAFNIYADHHPYLFDRGLIRTMWAGFYVKTLCQLTVDYTGFKEYNPRIVLHARMGMYARTLDISTYNLLQSSASALDLMRMHLQGLQDTIKSDLQVAGQMYFKVPGVEGSWMR